MWLYYSQIETIGIENFANDNQKLLINSSMKNTFLETIRYSYFIESPLCFEYHETSKKWMRVIWDEKKLDNKLKSSRHIKQKSRRNGVSFNWW